MISESDILKDLKEFHIIDQKAEPEEASSAEYEKYSIDHFRKACGLIAELADRAQLEDRLRIMKFGLSDAQDSTVENSLITFLAFGISAIALYITMSPDVPLMIDDWLLVTIFAGSFIILFGVLLAERFRNRKRRFYCDVFDCALGKLKE